MALVLKDRVKETSTTTGTGSLSLDGAATGFQSFSNIGDTNTTYYAIVNLSAPEWEVGIGTYSSFGSTLSRDTILESSNSGSAVDFSAGTKDVFCTYPAEKAVVLDSSGNLVVSGTTTLSGNQIISVTDNTNAALRITQLGTGNALLVEDSANPDATPFVISNSGQAIVGYTAPLTVGDADTLLQTHRAGSSGLLATRWTDSAFGPYYNLGKSRGTSVGTNTIVQSGDSLGTIQFCGDDGTDLVTPAAQIYAQVDGTPGTNDMPGRLVFSTTADGASSPTERMRIDSAGRVGIGGSAQAGDNLYIPKNIAGATVSYGVRVQSTIQSDVTDTVRAYQSAVATAASAFTLTNLTHFQAIQTTIGAGSTVTNQYGFNAASSLTGATNNYGFYSAIASGTGRYNFYASGTADNYFAGNVGIGTSSPSAKLDIRTGSAFDPLNAGTTPAIYASGVATAGIDAYGGAIAFSKPADGARPIGAIAGVQTTVDNEQGGLAFFVHGSATANSELQEKMRLTEAGKLILNSTSAGPSGINYNFQNIGKSTSEGVGLAMFLNTADSMNMRFAKSRSATVGSFTAVQSGDELGVIAFYGDDGTDINNRAASIVSYVDGTVATNSIPSRLVFSTAAVGGTSAAERMRIDSSGTVTLASGSGLSISATAVTSPASTDGNVFSGTYTPTLTNVTNVAASTAYVCQYMRVGNVVTVSGKIDIDPTATGAIEVDLTLPIASNFASVQQCGGTMNANTGSIVCAVSADTVNDKAQINGNSTTTANTGCFFIFTYTVV